MPRRAMYHVALDGEKIQGALFALLPGDPFRSRLIAERTGSVYGVPVPDGPLAHNSEYCTYLMDIRGREILITNALPL